MNVYEEIQSVIQYLQHKAEQKVRARLVLVLEDLVQEGSVPAETAIIIMQAYMSDSYPHESKMPSDPANNGSLVREAYGGLVLI